jgi:hypothetical protein
MADNSLISGFFFPDADVSELSDEEFEGEIESSLSVSLDAFELNEVELEVSSESLSLLDFLDFLLLDLFEALSEPDPSPFSLFLFELLLR